MSYRNQRENVKSESFSSSSGSTNVEYNFHSRSAASLSALLRETKRLTKATKRVVKLYKAAETDPELKRTLRTACVAVGLPPLQFVGSTLNPETETPPSKDPPSVESLASKTRQFKHVASVGEAFLQSGQQPTASSSNDSAPQTTALRTNVTSSPSGDQDVCEAGQQAAPPLGVNQSSCGPFHSSTTRTVTIISGGVMTFNGSVWDMSGADVQNVEVEWNDSDSDQDF